LAKPSFPPFWKLPVNSFDVMWNEITGYPFAVVAMIFALKYSSPAHRDVSA
jgi:hypothetical protein